MSLIMSTTENFFVIHMPMHSQNILEPNIHIIRDAAHTCPRCGHEARAPSEYRRHLKRKFPCNTTNNNIPLADILQELDTTHPVRQKLSRRVHMPYVTNASTLPTNVLATVPPNGDVPPNGNVPLTNENVPPTNENVPPTNENVPPTIVNVPLTNVNVPPTIVLATVPTNENVPPTNENVPLTIVNVPPTIVLATVPTNENVPPTIVNVPPTIVLATVPTNENVPPTIVLATVPTNENVPPTNVTVPTTTTATAPAPTNANVESVESRLMSLEAFVNKIWIMKKAF
jgi:hypothetical protein